MKHRTLELPVCLAGTAVWQDKVPALGLDAMYLSANTQHDVGRR
jgi:hypothetical protein